MTTYEWSTLRARGIELFNGDVPGPALEGEILQTFSIQPRAIAAAIERLGEGFSAGRIRSPWAVLGTEAIRMREGAPAAVADDATERERAVRAAEALIRNAGHMIDHETELLEVLFQTNGPLALFAKDLELRSLMVDFWRQRGPA